MTAEVAVLSKTGIALAADSAVTIQSKKTFNTTNKLFELSKSHPIAIMIYGSSEIMGVPWETIIKVYSRQLGGQSFDHLNHYMEDFLSFLKNNGTLFPIAEQKRHVWLNSYVFYMRIRKSLDDLVAEEIKNGPITDLTISLLFDRVLQKTAETYCSPEPLPYRDVNWLIDFESNYREDMDRSILEAFESLPISDGQRKNLYGIVAEYFARNFFESFTGIVIAGFGEKEIFPQLISHFVECHVNGTLKSCVDQIAYVDFNNAAQIVPFAQTDMVMTFCKGVHPTLHHQYLEILSRLANEFQNSAEKHLADPALLSHKEALVKEVQAISEKITQGLQDHIRDFYILPLMNAVGGLAAPDLAEIAETLIHLTSFKRRISHDIETVGGPVDVALITKGEGLVWIKRKHYFDPKLNPNYFRRNRYNFEDRQ